ncbi:MAG: NAD(+) synthase [Oscillospiraceae bacterium]|nr:NAD(+) synthase [Oscillospiraceae bacterium]
MNSIIRLGAAVNKVVLANPLECAEEIKNLLLDMPPSDVAVFPALSLCGTCGSLAGNKAVLEQCDVALGVLAEASRRMDSYVIAGVYIYDLGKPVSVMAVLYRGELVAYVPALESGASLTGYPCIEDTVPVNTVFACGDMRFCVLSCELSDIAVHAAEIAKTGCDLIIIPAYSPMYAGKMREVKMAVESLSSSLGCAVAVINGGVGGTSSPYVYDGFIAVYECGGELACANAGYESFSCTVDLDLDIIRACKKMRVSEPSSHKILPAGAKRGLLRHVGQIPFLPEKDVGIYLLELFSLQVRSLAARMENIGISRLVVGVSGGLDSTAALLVSAAAMDTLGLPRENITGITMPGFGTSLRTLENAMLLLEKTGVTKREISIKPSVLQHLEDIGHTGKKDTVYENAQARERAQILLDVANQVGGIVVGTGDLSEAALGFTTFAGDHIANYNVNANVTKTVLRALVKHVAESGTVPGISEIVSDILETPVSPELLPPDESGKTRQKTEDILAPYELLDFFLYYFIRYNFKPVKIYFYASVAFSGKYEPSYIKEKLRMFLQRFCAAQFKRSCSPDGAVITDVSLSNADFYIPSDMDSSVLLKELDDYDFERK